MTADAFRVGSIAILALICTFTVTANNNTASYVVNKTNSKPYYHLMFSLTRDNVYSLSKLTKQEFYDDGGQFEIRIDKDLFPIRAPNCDSQIILRMPWSSKADSLEPNYDLYQRITLLTEGDSVPVAIELNPYIATDSDGIYLTHCNVFFRTKQGAYVGNVQP